jgi:hypothetical protein
MPPTEEAIETKLNTINSILQNNQYNNIETKKRSFYKNKICTLTLNTKKQNGLPLDIVGKK